MKIKISVNQFRNLAIIGLVITSIYLCFFFITKDSLAAPTDYRVEPVSGRWKYPVRYRVTNISSNPITLTWHLDCWDESVCTDEFEQKIVAPNEYIEEGFGSICSKWQLDITSQLPYSPSFNESSLSSNPVWEEGNVAEKDPGCAFPPIATSGTIAFDESSRSVCIYNQQNYRQNGTINLSPTNATAILRTTYKVINPTSKATEIRYRTRSVRNGDRFYIDGQWPGIDSTDTLVQTEYGATLINPETGSVIPSTGGTIYLTWYPSTCSAPSPYTPINPIVLLGNFEGIPQTFVEKSTLQTGIVYWVKLNFYGSGDQSTVNERINNTLLEIIPPNYNDPTLGSTFKITKRSGTGEVEDQNNLCPDNSPLNGIPDCITTITSSNLVMNIKPVPKDELRSIYFMVRPRGTGSGGINLSTGTITYNNVATPVNIPAGGPINIPDDDTPYFQINGGNAYSNILQSLISTTVRFFSKSPESIVYYKDSKDLGDGIVSSSRREVKNEVVNAFSYDSFYERYKSFTQDTDITPANINGTRGYHRPTNMSNGKLVLGTSNGWNTGPIDGKAVIFVDGDLYIDQGATISVKKDGRSALAFIVNGRIGIHPSITNLEGIYLSEGIIDTSCTPQTQAEGNMNCNPGKTVATALTLRGMFLSNQGFNLDRQGDTTIPGETFEYRPDMLLSASDMLGQYKFSWKEI